MNRTDRIAFAIFLSGLVIGTIVLVCVFVWRADEPVPPGWTWLGGGVIYRCDDGVGAYRMLQGDHITFIGNDPRCTR